MDILEVKKYLEKDKTNTLKHQASVAAKYYRGEHDILDYRLFYYNADGQLVEDKTRSNIKIAHAFFTELVDQQVQYMLSNKNAFITSGDEGTNNMLARVFDDGFTAVLHELLTGVVVKGCEYLYVYRKTGGGFGFQIANSLNVITTPTGHILYIHKDPFTNVMTVSVYDDKTVQKYKINSNNDLVPDGDPVLHSMGFVPFFKLENNAECSSALKPIKTLIDDYDIMSCGMSNNLVDFDNPLHVVRGIQGENLDELQRNIRTKKVLGVDDGGGVEVHTVNIPYQARLTKMQEDEKNIYRFGMGFNSALVGDGNVTNVVIKSRYALLDLKCNKLEIRLRQFLKNLIEVLFGGRVSNYSFDFTRQIMTNALDNAQIALLKQQAVQAQIQTLLSLDGVVSEDFISQRITQLLEANTTQQQ